MKSRIVLLLSILLCAGCSKKQTEQQPVPRYAFTPPVASPSFSGSRAMHLLVQQVGYGPRNPNSPSHDSCLTFLIKHLSPLADTLSLQHFSLPGYGGERLMLTNVIASFQARNPVRILLSAHWDTRPRADRDPNPAFHDTPIPGANDGASGVAILLHLAEIFHKTPPPIGIDIVLFDGEDYGKENDESMYLLGSRYFSASLPASYKPQFGILLDLVGDRDAVFRPEEYSMKFAPDIVTLVWNTAQRLGVRQFISTPGGGILDDHVPLNTRAGIRTINIIDQDLVGHKAPQERRKYWHTMQDIPAQCSSDVLESVGKVLLHVVYGLRPA